MIIHNIYKGWGWTRMRPLSFLTKTIWKVTYYGIFDRFVIFKLEYEHLKWLNQFKSFTQTNWIDWSSHLDVQKVYKIFHQMNMKFEAKMGPYRIYSFIKEGAFYLFIRSEVAVLVHPKFQEPVFSYVLLKLCWLFQYKVCNNCHFIWT